MYSMFQCLEDGSQMQIREYHITKLKFKKQKSDLCRRARKSFRICVKMLGKKQINLSPIQLKNRPAKETT